MTSSSQGLLPLVEALLAASRSRTSWNERFEHWEMPASETEESQIKRSAAMVQRALDNNSWLVREGVQVRPQGSYHNNTNVRQDSDMDLCAWHAGIRVLTEDGLTTGEVYRTLGYSSTTGRMIPDIAADLRRAVGHALGAAFGDAHVHGGNKAFRVSAVPGSRADADVVPAVHLDYVFKRGSGLFYSLDRVEGVIIYAQDGTQVLNFPQQHHQNGKVKRERTNHRFKKVVRTAKRLRDELVTLRQLQPGQVPSFLIECLVYGVEDSTFLFDEDRYDRLRRVLCRVGEQLLNPFWTATAREINEVKLLFHESQPWSTAGAQAFVTAALRRLES